MRWRRPAKCFAGREVYCFPTGAGSTSIKAHIQMTEIHDPLHGFIFANDLERALIDSPEVQRLKYIHQLALTYPGIPWSYALKV